MGKYTAIQKICERCGNQFAPTSNSAKWCDTCCTYICKWCGKSFFSRRNRKVRFCSVDCTNHWQATQEAKRKAHHKTIEKRGRGEVRRCLTCQELFYTPGWLIDKGGGKYCSRICRRISLKLICPICGKSFKIPPSDIRSVNYCSRDCLAIGTVNRIANGEIFKEATKLEIAGQEILKSIGVEFLEQQAIGKFVVDALIPKAKIVIQWDGDFWHGNPAKFQTFTKIQQQNIERDKKCDAYLSKCGYMVLRFWENDVHSSPSWVTVEIEKALINSAKT